MGDDAQGPRVTRAREKRRRHEEGIPEEPPKPKIQTLGRYLQDEREKQVEALLEQQGVTDFEPFHDYDKAHVIERFSAQEAAVFQGQLYKCPEGGPPLVFLNLDTGDRPSTFTHICNNSCLKWNLVSLNIPTIAYSFTLPGVVMLFVRGKNVQDTSEAGPTYKYLGLIGLQSVSSSGSLYVSATFVFDNLWTRGELALFGEHVARCKKNKYGCSLCA